MTEFIDEIPDDEIDLCEQALREAVAALARQAAPDAHDVNRFLLTNTPCLEMIYSALEPQLRFDVWARRRIIELWREVSPKLA